MNKPILHQTFRFPDRHRQTLEKRQKRWTNKPQLIRSQQKYNNQDNRVGNLQNAFGKRQRITNYHNGNGASRQIPIANIHICDFTNASDQVEKKKRFSFFIYQNNHHHRNSLSDISFVVETFLRRFLSKKINGN